MSAHSFIKLLESNDDAYMQAVERGDMETAQRMVDEAAKRAGYNTEAWHGTAGSVFNSFNINQTPVNDDGYMGRAVYFHEDIGSARAYSEMTYDLKGGRMRVIRAYLKVANPLIGADTYGMPRNSIESWTDKHIEAGFDGATNGHGEWAVFHTEHIKSADPVTYDDQGKPIPLSQRFNSTSDDIRY